MILVTEAQISKVNSEQNSPCFDMKLIFSDVVKCLFLYQYNWSFHLFTQSNNLPQ